MYTLLQPQAIQAVFFDVGNTMLTPHPSVEDIVGSVCEQRGTPVDRSCLEQRMPHAEAMLRAMVRDNPWTWSQDSAIEMVWRAYFTDLLAPCLEHLPQSELAVCAEDVRIVFEQASSYVLYPDVEPVLATLHEQGVTLGIISDWGISLGLILRHHDLIQYFDFAVISAAVRLSKPDPELFQTALRRANTIADYAVHVGDSYPLDVLGARAAGITPILLDRAGIYDPSQLDCITIPDLYGLLDVLQIAKAETN
ncbi:MAG: HAD family hydrolase [Ktedonobacterales bacterium]